MKLIRFGDRGHERAGLIDEGGRVRDISGHVRDIAGDALGAGSLAQIAALSARSDLPVVREPVRLGACVGQVGKIICVGLNYHEHVREVGATVPSEPVLFMKATSALCGPFDDVMIPPDAKAVDWEVELGVVIGTRACRVPVSETLAHVAGYCVVNDLSERDWQLKGTGQWVKGKSADTFAPIGPWLVTSDAIADPQQLDLHLSVNGETQQSGSTRDMVFSVTQIVSYVSRFMTLLPGDLISTGTPPGVGMGKNPPRFLRSGDVVELSVTSLGTQRQRLVNAA